MKNTKPTPREAFELIYNRLNFMHGDCFYGEEARVVREALDAMEMLARPHSHPNEQC